MTELPVFALVGDDTDGKFEVFEAGPHRIHLETTMGQMKVKLRGLLTHDSLTDDDAESLAAAVRSLRIVNATLTIKEE